MADTTDSSPVKERLTESLSSARDVTVVAVRDDILPAVAAVALAAKDAAGPAYSEATNRAGNAVIALKGSDAAASLLATSAGAAGALKLKSKKKTKSRRPTKRIVFISLVGASGAAYGIMRKRNAPTAATYEAATMPGVFPVPDAEEIALDDAPETTE